jgi:prevent-host-death family protein
VAGSHEVAGSSPASSIAADCSPATVDCNPLRDRFGEWIERVAAGEEVILTRRRKPLVRLLPV